jgi:hypothetical protein
MVRGCCGQYAQKWIRAPFSHEGQPMDTGLAALLFYKILFIILLVTLLPSLRDHLLPVPPEIAKTRNRTDSEHTENLFRLRSSNSACE